MIVLSIEKQPPTVQPTPFFRGIGRISRFVGQIDLLILYKFPRFHQNPLVATDLAWWAKMTVAALTSRRGSKINHSCDHQNLSVIFALSDCDRKLALTFTNSKWLRLSF